MSDAPSPDPQGARDTREARRFFGWSGFALAVISALVVGTVIGWGPALLVAAGASLIGTLALVWRSIESLTEDASLDLEEALSLAAPNEEEERKRSILRALRDLDYERSVGKVSDDDYHELSQRYRAEAKRVLRQIDEDLGPARKEAERALQRELFKAGLADAPPASDSAAASPASEVATPSAAAPTTTAAAPDATETVTVPAPKPTRGCTYCGERNELLVTSCKACGRELAAGGERLCHSCPARYPKDETICPVCGVEGMDL